MCCSQRLPDIYRTASQWTIRLMLSPIPPNLEPPSPMFHPLRHSCMRKPTKYDFPRLLYHPLVGYNSRLTPELTPIHVYIDLLNISAKSAKEHRPPYKVLIHHHACPMQAHTMCFLKTACNSAGTEWDVGHGNHTKKASWEQ